MALSKFKLDAQVYGTWPVQKLGQLTLYEAYQNRCMEGEFSAFSLEDVDEAFNRVRPVKYSQNVILHKDNEVLVCVPMPAGHRVGSAVWKIRKEATDLIYATSFNLRKESTLFGSALHTEKSASVFITDAHCIHATDARLKDRETKLVKIVLDCLRAGGNVLMPCDATGRVLELLYMLGRHWDANRIGTYDLVFLAHVAFSTLEFARSMLEWMADLSGRKNNPFDFRHVFICRSLQQMDALGPNPKLVLATDASLNSGMAKELLLRWGGDPQNLVLFTQR
jgi:cleavage and polyadenylation specificity factor subunit 2